MSRRVLFVESAGGLIARGAGAGASDPASIRLQAGCIRALQRFLGAGFECVLLVDPSASDDAALGGFVQSLFASQGVGFDAVLRCKHGDSAGCDCALPGAGLVAEYIADAGLDRAGSIVVGDRPEMLALARSMGVPGQMLDGSTGWSEIAHMVLDRPRRAEIRRKTRETDIVVRVDLDQPGEPRIATGIGFFDHMLEQLGKHGSFALGVDCQGDLQVDEHHTVEDVALAIGQALREALGDKRGIGRYGFLLPMDEAEAQVAIDLSGRAYFVFEGQFPRPQVGGLPTELVSHFFRSLSDELRAAIHISVRGENTHHMVEACFKGVARALRQALARTADNALPSTKGAL